MRKSKTLFAVIATVAVMSAIAWAESRMVVQGKDSTKILRDLSVTTGGVLLINQSAQTSGTWTEVLVLNSAATAVPATPLVGRRAIEIQNNHATNAIWCRAGGGIPTVTVGRKIAAAGDTWAFDASDAVIVKCISASADQSSGSATSVQEIK